MLLHFAQSVPVESVLAAPATAVLGLVTVLLVLALIFTVRALLLARKNGNGHAEETPAEAIAKSIAVIEREGTDMPRPWREFIEARIKHHDRNRRAVVMAYVHLLERGHSEQVIRLLRDEADEG